MCAALISEPRLNRPPHYPACTPTLRIALRVLVLPPQQSIPQLRVAGQIVLTPEMATAIKPEELVAVCTDLIQDADLQIVDVILTVVSVALVRARPALLIKRRELQEFGASEKIKSPPLSAPPGANFPFAAQ